MTDVSLEKEVIEKPRNQWLDVWDQFKTHKGAVFGLGLFDLYHAVRDHRSVAVAGGSRQA